MSEVLTLSPNSTDDERQKAVGLLEDYLDKSVTPDVIIDRYTDTCQRYDKAMGMINYSGPSRTAKALQELHPSNRDKVHVLDMAAGTGLCAIEMRKLGFQNIDAFDASEGMLKEAKAKGLYKDYILGFLGNDTLGIETDSYDAITLSGFSTDLMQKLPIKGFEELVRIVKPGGHIVNTTYYEAFADDNPEAVQFIKNMKTLQTGGKIKLMKFQRFEEYLNGHDGAVRVHQVCK